MNNKVNNKLIIITLVLLIIFLCGCNKNETNSELTVNNNDVVKEKEDMNLKLLINETQISVLWEDNDSVKALYEYANNNTLTIDMRMYGGFEQVGSLGINLPTDDKNITTKAGDIVLYNGNQIVVFYGSNTWSYTKLGQVENASVDYMKQLLDNGDVTVSLKVD